MKNRYWHIECPKCEKSIDVSVGNFRKIIENDIEFILKPAFICSICKGECMIELKGES